MASAGPNPLAGTADGVAVVGSKPEAANGNKADDLPAKAPGKHVSFPEDAGAPGDEQSGQQQKVPVVLVRAIDMYAAQPKPPTVAGGAVTILAVLAALAYTVVQLNNYAHMPPTTTSFVEWSDTQGPFPARIRCTAPSGCWVSNRHNDRWSSNGDQVEAIQQGCMYMKQGDEHIMNITFTQNTYNGLVMVWDPTTWENGTTPESGLQIMAETNYPSAPEGIFVLATPILGGTYLANHVLTLNHTAPVAKVRREWFITYVSSDSKVVPATTACASELTATQIADYTQASLRMPSQWYRVTVEPPNLLLTLVGSCGGALQLCLQAGAILLLAYEILGDLSRRWISRRISPTGPAAFGRNSTGGGPQNPQLSGTSYIYVDQATGQHFAVVNSGAGDARGAPAAGRGELLLHSSVTGTSDWPAVHPAPVPQRFKASPGLKPSIDGSAE